MSKAVIQGFSKLSRHEKLRILEQQSGIQGLVTEFDTYQHPDKQAIFDSFSENVLTNYHLPYSIAPNFLINNKIYHIPMVVEESSVVAAASSAAKFWASNGGFIARVISTIKTGQVHFKWSGKKELLTNIFPSIEEKLYSGTKNIVEKMEQRGGGIRSISLEDCTRDLPDYYRLNVSFETMDSMGANFINTTLEQMAVSLKSILDSELNDEGECDIIMAVLSNYTPECFVECRVEAPVEMFSRIDGKISGDAFAERFVTAVQIAEIDPFRAVTHNKGIMNGVDAVVLATGNDFRAVEADVHAYASRNGGYTSLSKAYVDEEVFHLSVTLPLSVGTTGGLTSLHPLAKRSLDILGQPNARELMMIIASAGLANHFSAIKALITSGIQKGHMKMHLGNILAQLGASDEQKQSAIKWFKDKTVSVAAVRDFLEKLAKKSI
jgi:hydroxymethylglutaryl-CoA reductase